MILIDANLLLHAYNPQSPDHDRSKLWLEDVLSSPTLVRFAWLTLWAFIRIATNPRVFVRPLTIAEANEVVSSWLAQPNAGVLEPGERHWSILQGLLSDGHAAGPLAMDAALAAIAVEHGATLCTTDRDFSRFPGLASTNPLLARR